jgi:hypothetical protein
VLRADHYLCPLYDLYGELSTLLAALIALGLLDLGAKFA